MIPESVVMNELGAKPVFFVQNAARALEFYTAKLGFTSDWVYEENGLPYVAQVSLLGLRIILNQQEAPADERPGRGRIFIGLDDEQSAAILRHIETKGIAAAYAHWGEPTLAIYDQDRNEMFFWLSDVEREKWRRAHVAP